MTDIEFAAFLRLLMCSDPWPVEDADSEASVKAWADGEAARRGFSGWVDAYHQMA